MSWRHNYYEACYFEDLQNIWFRWNLSIWIREIHDERDYNIVLVAYAL
jgi:hypothetical protein